MVLQARAEATRRRIIDSAVDLFIELGYGETGLADVLQRAGVSKGAFYYHFDSKEAVAAAIIAEFDRRVGAAIDEHYDAASPSLESIVAGTFAVQALMHTDRMTQVGHTLCQALHQISTASAQVYLGWTERFTDMVKSAVAAGELSGDVHPEELADAIWTGMLGCNLISAAIGDDPYARLARSWRVFLRIAVPADSVDRFDALLDRIAARYQPASVL